MTEVSKLFVYLAHFSQPFRHAQHYIGKTNNLDRRELEHRAGRGSRLLKIISDVGIDWSIVRTWEFPDGKSASQFERALKKKQKSSRRFCPVCHDEFLERQRHTRRNRKQKEILRVYISERQNNPHVE